MPESNGDALTDAVARNAAAVLSLPSAGMLRHHKSRFLGESERTVWVESVPAEHPLIHELIAHGLPCGVSFKLGQRKIDFAGRVLELNPAYEVSETVTVPALLLERPPEVRAVQRRNDYRARVSEKSGLKVQVWRLPSHVQVTDAPPLGAELCVQLIDLSAGGIGITVLPKDGQPPKVVEGERVRVLLQGVTRNDLLLEGRIRPLHPLPNGTTLTGVQFTKLQEGVQGRRITAELTKLVGELQLAEVRRNKLLAAG